MTGSNVCGNNKQDVSTNVLIEGAYFHDLEYDASAPDAHWECMYLNGGRNVTIRGNRFERCAIFDLFVTISGPDAGAIGHENLTIENNWFAPATNGLGSPAMGWSSLSVAWCGNSSQPAYRNVRSATTLWARGRDRKGPQLRCVRLSVAERECDRKHRDVWRLHKRMVVLTQPLGGIEQVQRIGSEHQLPAHLNPAGFDYHLAAGSAAEGFVPGALCPAADFDGQSRATPCDASSDER